MSGFQSRLDRINRKWGGIGSIIVTGMWLAILVYALVVILSDAF